MATELYDLTVQEVSLVDNGANGRKFLLMKRGDNNMQKNNTASTDLSANWRQSAINRDWWQLADTLGDTLRAIMSIENIPERVGLLTKAIDDFKALIVTRWDITKKASDEDITAQKARAEKYGISVKEGKAVTLPAEYRGLTDNDFADPVNYSYPITENYIRAARAYSAKKNAQIDGGYNDAEWKIITDRTTAAAKKYKIGEFAEAAKKNDEAVDKAGAVLSAKNKEIVQTAIDALQGILTATVGMPAGTDDINKIKEEVKKQIDDLKKEAGEAEIDIKTDIEKIVNDVIIKQSQIPTWDEVSVIVDNVLKTRR